MTETKIYYTVARWVEKDNLWVNSQNHLTWPYSNSPGLLDLVGERNRDLRDYWPDVPKEFHFWVAKVTEKIDKTVERVE